jgi:hypothetical protein
MKPQKIVKNTSALIFDIKLWALKSEYKSDYMEDFGFAVYPLIQPWCRNHYFISGVTQL